MDVILSIVVPTRNRRVLLADAIASIAPLAVLGAVEVIVADDGSTDGTGQFIESHPMSDSQSEGIRLLYSGTEERRGAQAARNRGVSLARGRSVMFLDSDDVLIADGIAALVNRLETDSTLDFVHGKIVRTDSQLRPIAGEDTIGRAYDPKDSEIAGYHWPIMGVVYRREYLGKVGPWNEALSGAQDWEYQARVKLAGGRGQFIDTLVGCWRQHDGERVGTKTFREDYVRSVILACDSILRAAQKVGRCDEGLEKRLAKILVVHALELGNCGFHAARDQCFNQAANCLSTKSALRTTIKCWSFLPASSDGWCRKILLLITQSKKSYRSAARAASSDPAMPLATPTGVVGPQPCADPVEGQSAPSPIRLSVIIPCRDRVDLLRECIQSVVCQKLPGVEILVCDDGSTEDLTGLQEFFGNGINPVLWSSTPSSHGAPAARNRGVALARGQAVLFLDSDDVLTGPGPALLLRALEEDPQLDFTYGKVLITDDQLRPLPGALPVGEAYTAAPVEIGGYHFHTMGAMYRKSFLAKVGPWNEALTGSQDWEYQARVKLAGGRGRFIDTFMGYWRQHGGNRVGTKTFRLDYVRSVLLACATILQAAQQAGRCDRDLERRLAKKILLHALEYGANGYRPERNAAFRQASCTLSQSFLLRHLVRLLALTPLTLDHFLWRRFQRSGTEGSGQ